MGKGEFRGSVGSNKICPFSTPYILEYIMNISGLHEALKATGHLQPTVHVSGIPKLHTSIAC